MSINDGSNDGATITYTVTVADANDQTPVYQAADADDAITVNENVGTGSIDAGTITDTDTVGTYGCTLGGADAADFACSISGSTVNIAFAADPNYESPADADTNNEYIVTVLINDGVADDANGATTLTITVADVNDITPVYQAADADDAISVNENVGTGSIDAGTITDADTVGTYACTLSGADAADFACSISGSTVNIAFASSPDYENPADADTNNVYVVDVLINDGANDDANGATTLTITVADLNDQAPVYQAADADDAISVAEGFGTGTLDAGTITDTDTVGTLGCTLGGADAADFTCSISGNNANLAFAVNPDYENPADADGNNIYVVTVLVDDDNANDPNGATTLTITVTDAGVTITGSQSFSVAENAANDAAVGSVATSGDTPTLFSITGGNSDGIFGISNAGAITVADNTNLDYDTTNSYTLTIVASDASSADVETVTIGVTDINDITPVYQAADADDAITVNENVGTGSIDAGTITDADTVGTYSCTLGGADAADFACSISGSTVNIAFAADPNYESPADADTNNEYIVTVLINDGVANDANGATTLTITVADVNDITPVYQAADADDAISVNENVGTGSIDAGTITDADTVGTYGCTLSGADAADFACSISGSTVNIAFASSPDYDNPADADTNNVYVVDVLINDGANDDANGATTLTITVADLNDQAPSFTSSNTVNVAEGATAVVTLAATDTDTADSGGLDYAIVTDDPAGGTQFALTGTSLTIAAQDYETPGCGAGADSRTCVVIVSATDDAGTATQQTITVTITDTNDQTPVYQAADADDAISVNENVGTGSIDAGTITDTDTVGTYSCTT